jgi:hypothetical protein
LTGIRVNVAASHRRVTNQHISCAFAEAVAANLIVTAEIPAVTAVVGIRFQVDTIVPALVKAGRTAQAALAVYALEPLITDIAASAAVEDVGRNIVTIPVTVRCHPD